MNTDNEATLTEYRRRLNAGNITSAHLFFLENQAAVYDAINAETQARQAAQAAPPLDTATIAANESKLARWQSLQARNPFDASAYYLANVDAISAAKLHRQRVEAGRVSQ